MVEQAIKIGLEEKVDVGRSIIYGLQHMIAMFAGVIAAPLIVGGAIGLEPLEKTVLIQGALLAGGIGTILQSMRIGFVGAKLPIAMGTSFVFIAPMIAIGNSWGIATIFGAMMVCGLIEFAVAPFIWRIKRFFPPLVTGTVVALIGLLLIPVGFRWAAGGFGDMYGQPIAFVISGLVLVIMLAASCFAKGFMQTVSIIFAIVCGYAVAGMFGVLDLSDIGKAEWFAMPKVLAFGMPEFHIGAILGILVAQFASMLETIGDTYATGVVLGEKIEKEHLRGAVAVDGIGSFIGNFFNGFSLTSFSQNIGVIGITGVGSRHVVRVGGIILVVLALFPKLAALIVAMPEPVLGGAAIVMFGAVVAAGISQLSVGRDRFSQRSLLIFATAIGLGVGFGLADNEALQNLPDALQSILHSGVVVGGVVAILLNEFLPGKEE